MIIAWLDHPVQEWKIARKKKLSRANDWMCTWVSNYNSEDTLYIERFVR